MHRRSAMVNSDPNAAKRFEKTRPSPTDAINNGLEHVPQPGDEGHHAEIPLP